MRASTAATWEDRRVPILTTWPTLEAALDHLRAAPADAGTLAMVVRRPDVGVREILDEGVLDEADGLVGDNWLVRATSRAIAEGRHLDAMITVMSARMVGLLGDTDDERALAGDQLYVDLDLSHDNLPAGTRIAVGDDAVLEVTAKPHAGLQEVPGPVRRGRRSPSSTARSGSRLRLRGLNARVVHGGVVRPGDVVRRLTSARFFRTPQRHLSILPDSPGRVRVMRTTRTAERAGQPTRVGSGAACSTRDLVAVRVRSPAGGRPHPPSARTSDGPVLPPEPRPRSGLRGKGLAATVVAASLLVGGAAGVGGAAVVDLDARPRCSPRRSSPRPAARPPRPPRPARSRRSPRACCPRWSRST